MKKLTSTAYSASAFNIALLLLRVGAGILMIAHGYDKLVHFNMYAAQFVNLMGIGTRASLSLVIFAEFFCSMFVMLGLFTRLAVIPLIITMSVVVFKVHQSDFFGKAEHPALFLLIFLLILLVGPGRASIDGAVGK